VSLRGALQKQYVSKNKYNYKSIRFIKRVLHQNNAHEFILHMHDLLVLADSKI